MGTPCEQKAEGVPCLFNASMAREKVSEGRMRVFLEGNKVFVNGKLKIENGKLFNSLALIYFTI